MYTNAVDIEQKLSIEAISKAISALERNTENYLANELDHIKVSDATALRLKNAAKMIETAETRNMMAMFNGVKVVTSKFCPDNKAVLTDRHGHVIGILELE